MFETLGSRDGHQRASSLTLLYRPYVLKGLSGLLLGACFLLLLATPSWHGNEINYFDLSQRWIEPERYTDAHAIRDSSVGRIVSFLAIGICIQTFGMEGAYRALEILLLIASPMAYLAIVRALKADLFSAALTLALICIYGQQSLVGGEFLFGTVEPKSFAYIFVLFGLRYALFGRRVLTSVLLAIAVYFHFLVGAFWAVAIFGFFVLQDRHLFRFWRSFACFVSLTLPLFAAIVIERQSGTIIDLNTSSISLNAIYAEFRAPHHMAPFVDRSVFFSDWLSGLVLHGVVGVFWLLSARRGNQIERNISIWIATLNLYVLIAALIAYFDRHTHAFAWFYLFRPSALILLLSLLWGGAQMISPALTRRPAAFLLVLVALLSSVWSASASAAMRVIQGPVPLSAMLTPEETEMVTWIRKFSDSEHIVLIEPSPLADYLDGEGGGQWAGIERLIERPTLVNFKFVPTAKADLARWYDLLLWREAVFAGGCARIYDYPVHYLITRARDSVERLSACADIVWQGETNAILGVRPKSEPVPTE